MWHNNVLFLRHCYNRVQRGQEMEVFWYSRPKSESSRVQMTAYWVQSAWVGLLLQVLCLCCVSTSTTWGYPTRLAISCDHVLRYNCHSRKLLFEVTWRVWSMKCRKKTTCIATFTYCGCNRCPIMLLEVLGCSLCKRLFTTGPKMYPWNTCSMSKSCQRIRDVVTKPPVLPYLSL